MDHLINLSHTIKLKKILLLAFLFFCFFPYIRILPLDLDSQPNALILSIPIILFIAKGEINKDISWLIFILIAATVCMLLSNPNNEGIRILTTYLSLTLITYATYLSLKYFRGIPYSFYEYVVLIWFIVGFVQYTIYPSFMDFLILRSNNSILLEHGRGVTSLAVEPTFYGMICLLLLMINHLNFRFENKYHMINLLLLIQLIIFSRSTTCFGIIIITIFTYGIYMILQSKYRIRWFLLCFLLMIIGYFIATWLINNLNIRATNALRVLINTPSEFLVMDYSVNRRFVHAFFPIKGFIDNLGMPHGLGHFDEYLQDLTKNESWNVLINYDISNEKRITASLGASLFELGVFSFPLYYVIIRSFKKIASNNPKAILCEFLLFSLMLNHMNFNQAILPMFIGNLIYTASKSGHTQYVSNT